MKIRKATIKDISQINEIYVAGAIDECKLQYPKKSKKELIKEFEKEKKDRLKGFRKDMKKDYFIVVIENNKIIAFGQAGFDKIEKTKGSIEKIYIRKEFRKRGIGIKIAKELIKWLKKHRAKEIWAGLYIKNKASMNLHKKLGFKIRAVGMEKKIK